jgi:hypothetical protein
MRRCHVVAVLTLALVLTGPGIVHASNDRDFTINCLQRIVKGMQFHVEITGTLPTDICDPQGRPLLSWRVRLLPFIEQQTLYQQFHLDEPWDSPHNRQLIHHMPLNCYYFPWCKVADGVNGLTPCLQPRGDTTVFARDPRIVRPIRGDLSRTVLVVEAEDDQAVIWTKPQDLDFDPKHPHVGLARHWMIGYHDESGCLAGCANGEVRFIPASAGDDLVRSLFAADGATVPLEQPWSEVMFREPFFSEGWPSWLIGLCAVVGAMPIGFRVLRGKPTSPGEFLWLIVAAMLLTHFICVVTLLRLKLAPMMYEWFWNSPGYELWPWLVGVLFALVALVWFRRVPIWRGVFAFNLFLLALSIGGRPHYPKSLDYLNGWRMPQGLFALGLLSIVMMITTLAAQRTAEYPPRRLPHWLGLIVVLLLTCWGLSFGAIVPQFACMTPTVLD